MLEKINANFDAAANKALLSLAEVSFEINDHMIPEKTAALLDIFKQRKQQEYRARATGITAGQKPPLVAPTADAPKLADGNYRVKDLTLSVDTVLFKYGPNKFALPHAVKISAGIPAESAQIDIRKGTVVSIQV